jgi:hypothetical protein
MLLPLATVLGLTGCSYVRDPAVSERRALVRMGYTKKNEESVRGGLDRHRLPAVGVVAIFRIGDS